MRNAFRRLVALIIFSPIVATAWILSLFAGKGKACTSLGPITTFLARQSLRFWVPVIESGEDFDRFPAKMKRNLWIWRPFYDIEIVEESRDAFRLRLSNCPFCEVLNACGLSGLSPYVCEGDWVVARENRDKWIFEREHQIGTGDAYCDHTYKRTLREHPWGHS